MCNTTSTWFEVDTGDPVETDDDYDGSSAGVRVGGALAGEPSKTAHALAVMRAGRCASLPGTLTKLPGDCRRIARSA